MPILNTFSGGGGGIRIPLEPVTNFVLSRRDGVALISWVDPVDKVATPGGELVAEWNYTLVVRKAGSPPLTPTDGYQVLRTTSRDQYPSSAPYTDTDLENGVTYYYAAYSYTTIGVPSSAAVESVTPLAAAPEFVETRTPTISHGVGGAISSSQNHIIINGGDGVSNLTTYDENLTEGTLPLYTTLSVKDSRPEKFNGYAVFHGGRYGSNTLGYSTLYSPSLSRSSLAPQNNQYDYEYSVGIGASDTHLIYAGGIGEYSSDDDGQTIVTAYDTAFTAFYPEVLTQKTKFLAGVKAGEYVVFGGGTEYLNYSTSSVTAYSGSLTKVAVSQTLYGGRSQKNESSSNFLGTASAGQYGLFAGGAFNDRSASVTAYDGNLTRMPSLSLRASGCGSAGCSVSDYAVFIDGYSWKTTGFDNALTRKDNIGDPSGSTRTSFCQNSGIAGKYFMFADDDDKVHVYQVV